jgi:hypothetical protein
MDIVSVFPRHPKIIQLVGLSLSGITVTWELSQTSEASLKVICAVRIRIHVSLAIHENVLFLAASS